jgi:hypothetical protein
MYDNEAMQQIKARLTKTKQAAVNNDTEMKATGVSLVAASSLKSCSCCNQVASEPELHEEEELLGSAQATHSLRHAAEMRSIELPTQGNPDDVEKIGIWRPVRINLDQAEQTFLQISLHTQKSHSRFHAGYQQLTRAMLCSTNRSMIGEDSRKSAVVALDLVQHPRAS